ncbi:MAG: hypothetical protein MUF59_09935 [Candidatus Krumholzibacteria bacterium]|nr:hypothetical protein [Candidatus Krumholzibacteria bacterium]
MRRSIEPQGLQRLDMFRIDADALLDEGDPLGLIASVIRGLPSFENDVGLALHRVGGRERDGSPGIAGRLYPGYRPYDEWNRDDSENEQEHRADAEGDERLAAGSSEYHGPFDRGGRNGFAPRNKLLRHVEVVGEFLHLLVPHRGILLQGFVYYPRYEPAGLPARKLCEIGRVVHDVVHD